MFGSRLRAEAVDQPRPVENTEAVLDLALQHAAEPDEMVAREHLVLTEERE
jgi:hypothetical protein